jgi:hypothetical protein
MDSNQHDADRTGGGGLSNNPMLSFVPWVIFGVAAGPGTWELGVGCALLASIGLVILDLASGRERTGSGRVNLRAPKLLDIGTVAFFLALVIVGLIVDRQALIVLEDYAQAISSGALALIVLLSMAVGHPFTEQYAREEVPEEYWHTPVFRRTMFIMSGVWGAIFAAIAIMGAIDQTGVTGAGTSDWFNWYIPIALLIVGFKFNEWYPSQVQKSVARSSTANAR